MLSQLILNQVDTCLWDPIHLTNKDMCISHLFFADNLTLIARADLKNLNTIDKCLNLFCNLSRQNINLQKSKLFSSKIVL